MALCDEPAARRTSVGRAAPAARSCDGREGTRHGRRRRSQRRRPRGRRSGARQQHRRHCEVISIEIDLSGFYESERSSTPLNPLAAPFVLTTRASPPLDVQPALAAFSERVQGSVLSTCFDELVLAANYYMQLVRKRASQRHGGGAAVAAAIALINGP